MLLPIQASLPAAGLLSVHKTLGLASPILVAAMAFTALLTLQCACRRP